MGPLPSCTILNKLFFLTKRRSYSTETKVPRREAKGPPLATHLTAPPPGGGGTSSPQNRCFRQSQEASAGWQGAGPVRRAQSGRSLRWPGLSWASLALGNRHHGVGLQDRPVHPQQRPGQPGGRVPAHAGLGGRLPAPGCNGRVTPRGSGRAGRAGGVAAPQRAPVGCTAPLCDGRPPGSLCRGHRAGPGCLRGPGPSPSPPPVTSDTRTRKPPSVVRAFLSEAGRETEARCDRHDLSKLR